MPTLIDIDTHAAYTWTTPTLDFGRDNTEVRSAFSEIPGLLWEKISRHLFSIDYNAGQDQYSITQQSNREHIRVTLEDTDGSNRTLKWNQPITLNDKDGIFIDCSFGGKFEKFAAFVFFQDPKPKVVRYTYPEEESDWDILGLVKDSSIQDLKKQHQIMSRVFHPDKYKQNNFSDANQKKATETFQRINQAYEKLKAILKKRAIAANPKITEEELSKYAVRFGTSTPFIV